LAAAIEQQEPGSADENAALIAENLEAAGDLRAAFDWHMRAGGWLAIRDIRAARTSWQRARQVADRLPADAPDRTSMQIAPRTAMRHRLAGRWQCRRHRLRRTARSVHSG
jgi:adenylate cyclase